MLAADKELLESELKKKAIAIQNQELNLFVTNFSTVATTASMLAGFSYSALLHTDLSFSNQHTSMLGLFYFFTTVAMGSEMLALILATVCRIWGTGLALRGPAGSMRKSVEQMGNFQVWTVRLFVIGMLSFHMSAISYAWIGMSRAVLSALISGMLAFSMFCVCWVMKEVSCRFKVHSRELVTGTMEAARFMQGLETASLLYNGAPLPGGVSPVYYAGGGASRAGSGAGPELYSTKV